MTMCHLQPGTRRKDWSGGEYGEGGGDGGKGGGDGDDTDRRGEEEGRGDMEVVVKERDEALKDDLVGEMRGTAGDEGNVAMVEEVFSGRSDGGGGGEE